MVVTRVQEVVEHAERFERMLADYYAGLAHRSSREGVRLLTDYMSRHRVRLQEALSKLPTGSAERVFSAPLPCDPPVADCRCFRDLDLPADASACDVLDAAIRLDECLILLYREVLQQPVDHEVRELFESLLRHEQRDEVELKKIKAMDYF